MSKKFLTVAAAVCVLAIALASGPSHAEDSSNLDPRAMSVLKEMSDYLGDAKEFTFKGSARYEYVLKDGQKIEYGQNISVAVKRPKAVRAVVDGDVVARVFSFDGKHAAIYDPDSGHYAKTALSGELDSAIRTLIEKFGMTAPLADVILEDSYKALTDGLDSAIYVGIGEVDGVLCHQLAFRHDGRVDWQVWVEAGNSRVPRRIAIVYTAVAGQPEYRANLSDWSFFERFPEGLFSFDPPEGAVEIEFAQAVPRRSAD